MGHRIPQRLFEWTVCGKIPEDGKYMWYMGNEVWCEECCNKDYDDDTPLAKD